MEHDDREYTDLLNDELKDVEPGAGLHGKVRDGIARNVVRMRRRNTALGAVAIAIVLTMALSTVTPVFGRNGTLPQVIAAMAAERQAEKMSKTLGTAPVQQTGTALQTSVATVQTVSDSALSETDGILALVIADQSGKPAAEVLKMRTDGLGWGIIMSQLNVSSRDIGEAMSQAETVAVASSPSAASQGQGATSKPAVSNEQQARGKVTVVSATVLHIDGFANDIILNADTKVEQVGAGSTNIAAIKVGQTVQVHVVLSGTTYTAQQVHIEDAYVKTDTTADEDQQGTQPASNEQQARGKVTVVSATVLHIDGFGPDIILNADTKVEQVGAGSVDLSAIDEGQTVQVHVSLTGTTYTATQVHIEDKYVKPDTTANEDQTTNSAVTTWQGTIASIAPDAKSITLTTDTNPSATVVFHVVATSILQDAKLKAVALSRQLVGQKVTITAKVLANGSAEIVKLVVTTDTKVNPGKGNGKN
jgi:hypothetical protein